MTSVEGPAGGDLQGRSETAYPRWKEQRFMSIFSRLPAGWHEGDEIGSCVEREPTAAELAAIEAEWPVIEAELAALDAEIRALTAGGRVCELDRRRVRRAQRRVLGARRVASVPASSSEGVA